MDKKIDKSQLRREKMRRAIVWTVVVVAVGAAVAVAVSMTGRSVKSTDVTLATVERGTLDIMIPANGRVTPAVEEIITSPISTRILKTFVQPGDTVTQGTALLLLDLAEEQAAYDKNLDQCQIGRSHLKQTRLNNSTMLSDLAMQIDIKEMQVKALSIDVDNERRLDSLGTGTGDRVRQAESALHVARLELRQLREKLSNERLRSDAVEEAERLSINTMEKDLALSRRTLDHGRLSAPLSGVVTYLRCDIGAQVNAGERIAVISDLSSFKIDGEVAEGSSGRVAVGARVEAHLGKLTLPGRVTNITPRSKGGLVQFIVRLDNESHTALRAGLSTELYIAHGSKSDVTLLPRGSYFKGPGVYSLFVAEPGGKSLSLRRVTLGESNDKWVEVTRGLNPGESVAINDMTRFEGTKKLMID